MVLWAEELMWRTLLDSIKGGNLGKGQSKIWDHTMFIGYFKAAILHGFAQHFDKKGRLTFLGNHTNGKPEGNCWKIIWWGGCIVGRVNSAGNCTWRDIAFIYPDYATALVGQFIDGVLEKAQEAAIIDICVDKAGIKTPIFSEPTGNVNKRQKNWVILYLRSFYWGRYWLGGMSWKAYAGVGMYSNYLLMPLKLLQ